MPTVLVLANILHRKEGPYADTLRAAGLELRWPDNGWRQLSEAELAAELPGADATIAGSEPYTPAIFAANRGLRAIARTGVGYDSIDVPAASAARVAVAITPGANQDSVAEHALGLLLAAARNFARHDTDVKAGGFERPIPQPVRDRTLGLIGFGRTGKALATRAVALGMKVLAYEKHVPAGGVAVIEFASFDEVCRRSDYISLHAPLVPSTVRMIDAARLAMMRPGVRIINTARGALIDEVALAEALRSGHVASAGLDVFVDEPPVGSPLLSAPNVLLTPHLAGVDSDACDAMALMAAQNIVALSRGECDADRVVNAAAIAPWSW